MTQRHSSGTQHLPEPVGKVGLRAGIVMAVLSLLVAVGLFAHHVAEEQGLIVTGMRTPGLGGAAWGIQIGMDMYFVGISFAGVSVAALTRLMNISVLRPLTRIAELLTIVALLVSGLFVLSDLGRPLDGLLNLPNYARPLSPFFGTFTLVVSGTLFASLVFCYLSGRADALRAYRHGPRLLRPWYWLWASGYRGTPAERHRHGRVSFWLALCILPLLIIAQSTLGFIFGIQGGRPGWFSALQAPGFVVLAGCSGVGALIVVAGVVRKTLHLEDVLTDGAFRLLGNAMWVLTLIYLYFTCVEVLTSAYAATASESALTREVVFGDFAPFFWATVACMGFAVLVGLWQYVRGSTRVGWLMIAGLAINAGAVLRRLLIVVPSQTHGTLLPFDEPNRGYVPSLQEIGVVVGLSSLGALLYLIFAHVFPLVPTESVLPSDRPPRSATSRHLLRRCVFGATLVAGIAIAITGFLLSARVGTVVYDDPLVPYSPVIFIIGLLMVFYSPAIYETFPREPLPQDPAATDPAA
jgi:molybdopterin-containing oxidoreductase family membrane subunit